MMPTASRYDTRRPRVSAITPVGTSKKTCATVYAAFTSMTWKMSRPTDSRKRVLTPQMRDWASVVLAAMPR